MSGGGNTTSTTTSSVPPAYTQAYQGLVNQAQNVAGTPYAPYPGNLVAGLSPDQTSAISNIQNLQGVSTPYINAAAQEIGNSNTPVLTQGVQNLIGNATGPGITNAAGTAAGNITNTGLTAGNAINAAGNTAMGIGLNAAQNIGNTGAGYASGIAGAGASGASGITNAANTGISGINKAATSGVNEINAAGATMNPGAVNSWLSPYIGDVVNATEAQFSNTNQQQQTQLAGNAASAGAFGGDRYGVAQGVLGGQQQAAEAPVIAGLYNTGYDTALQALETQGAQAIQAATSAGQLGTSAALGAGQLGVTAATSAGQLGLGAEEAAGQLGLGAQEAAGQLGLSAGQLGLGATEASGQLGLGAQEAAGQMGLTGAEQSAALGLQGAGTELGANEAQNWLSSQAGYGFSNLGNQALNAGLTGANALLGIGGLEQNQAQAQLNVPYEQYIAQQAYPFQTTGWLGNLVEGLGSSAGGTASTTSNAGAGNTASNILGAGLAGTGILANTGAFTNAANAASGGGWLSGLFGGGGASAITPTTLFGGDAGGAIGDLIGATVARGGRIPHRAGGGGLPYGDAMPVSNMPPDVSVSVIPGASGLGVQSSGRGTFDLTNPNLATTTTQGSRGGSGIAGAIGPIASIAGLALAARRGGEVPERAFGGGLTDFPMHRTRIPGTGRGIVANDRLGGMHLPKLAAGGVAVPQLAGSPGTSFLSSPSGVPIPQLASGPAANAPVAGGGINAVNQYLAANSTPPAARPTPPPVPTPPTPAAPAPTVTVQTVPDQHTGNEGDIGGSGGETNTEGDASNGGMDAGGGGGESAGEGARGGGIAAIAKRDDGGQIWNPDNPVGTETTGPAISITPDNTSDWHDDVPPLGAGSTAGPMPHVASSIPTGPTVPPDRRADASASPEGGGGITAMPTSVELPPGAPAHATPDESVPKRNWGDTLIAMGAGMLARGSPNAFANIGTGLGVGLKQTELERAHQENFDLRKLQQEELSRWHQATAGIQQQRADTAQQRANTYDLTAQSRAAIASRMADYKAQGLSDAEAQHAIQNDIATKRLQVYQMSEQDRADRNAALQAYQNWHMQHGNATQEETQRWHDALIAKGATDEDIRLYTGSKDLMGKPTLNPTAAHAVAGDLRSQNAPPGRQQAPGPIYQDEQGNRAYKLPNGQWQPIE